MKSVKRRDEKNLLGRMHLGLGASFVYIASLLVDLYDFVDEIFNDECAQVF